MAIKLPVAYIRVEPTKDLDCGKPIVGGTDQVLYLDEQATELLCIIPFGQKSSKLSKRNKYFSVNYCKYRLVWLPPLN